MSPSPSTAAAACPPDLHGVELPPARQRSRARFIGSLQVPVRRYGEAPPPPDDMLYSDEEDDSGAGPRTIGERGGRAVWLAALVAGVVAGVLLYA